MTSKYKRLTRLGIVLGVVFLVLLGYKIGSREYAFLRELREARVNLIHVEPYEGDYIAFCYNEAEDKMTILRIEETLLGYDDIYAGIQWDTAIVIEEFGVAGFYFPELEEGKSAVYVGMLRDDNIDRVQMTKMNEENVSYEATAITADTGGQVVVIPMKDFDGSRIEIAARDDAGEVVFTLE